MRKLYPLLALAPLLVLGGCSNDATGVSPLKGIAASIVMAQGYDEFHRAEKRVDRYGIRRAVTQIQRAETVLPKGIVGPSTARDLINQANILYSYSQVTSGIGRQQLSELADAKYRVAIELIPAVGGLKALDPNTLNSIGYFLADQGKTLEDWKRAVTYTKAAYDRWPIPEGLAGAQARLNRAMLAQDSYAWALFKMGRFQEALVQAEEAVKTMRSINSAAISAEVIFHMAEIYRVVGEIDKARVEYETALQLSPTAELRQQILDGIKALEYKQV